MSLIFMLEYYYAGVAQGALHIERVETEPLRRGDSEKGRLRIVLPLAVL